MEGHDMQYPVTRRTAVQAAVAALLLTALAACSSSSGADRDTATAQTVATEPPTTTTTNPYAVPAVIDAAYVNRVLAGLDALMGDVARLIIDSRTIPREAYDRMKALYASDSTFMQLAIDGYQQDIRRNFAGYKPTPGNVLTTVTQLVSTSRSCVFAKVNRDYTQVGTNSVATDIQWIALTPLDPSRDPLRYNPTPFALAYEGFPRSRTQPPDPCAS